MPSKEYELERISGSADSQLMDMIKRTLLSLSLSLLFLWSTATADEGTIVTISFNKESCELRITQGEKSAATSCRYEEINVTNNRVNFRGEIVIADSILTIGKLSENLATLSVGGVSDREGFYDLTLVRKELSARQIRRGGADIVNLFHPIEIVERDFVRGSLISIAGDVTIRGEVNGHIVSLFGDVKLEDKGICHRDVYAVGGAIETSHESRIYGAVQSTEKWKRSDIVKRRRIKYGNDPIEWAPHISYNRVDGLEVGAGIAFYPPDNYVPSFFFNFGYGLESERGKYELGFKETIGDYNQLIFGGSAYRQSRTDDDWRAGRDENTLYALLNAEDYRDYWDGEGGKIYVEQSYKYVHHLRAQFSFEERDSLAAHRRLWSLFGGDHGFRSNFSSLPEQLRAAGQNSFTLDEALFEISYTFNSTFDLLQPQPHGWYAQILYQHSSEGIDSKFNYDRYRLELRRYQPLIHKLSLNTRALYGAVTGSPPLHRLFYLGGIRTLRGHKIKEFYGTRAALLNTELILQPDESIFAFAAILDLGVTGDSSDFLTDNRWQGDYGAGIWFFKALRLEATKPFGGSSDDFRISILGQHSF